MTAYVVFVRESTLDPEEMKIYGGKAAAARGEHKITPLAFYGRQEVLEGPQSEALAILSFPSFEEAQAWYRDPAYQEALQHRLKGADYRVILVDGL